MNPQQAAKRTTNISAGSQAYEAHLHSPLRSADGARLVRPVLW